MSDLSFKRSRWDRKDGQLLYQYIYTSSVEISRISTLIRLISTLLLYIYWYNNCPSFLSQRDVLNDRSLIIIK